MSKINSVILRKNGNELLKHLVWLSDKDHEGNTIGDFFAGSGSLLRAVDHADVILCDKNTEYFDKFFDIYVKDERVYTCERIIKK